MTRRPKTRTATRKKPKQERSAAMFEALLEAAARVFVREGYAKATTNRIADEAGVSVGSLYQYFPSKEALVAALVERHIEEMTREISGAIARVMPLPLPIAVRQLVELMLRAHAIDPALHRVLIEQVPRVGRLERIHDVEARVGTVARAYLAAHQHELRVEDVDLAAFLAVTTVEALTHATVLYHPERLAHPQLADQITDLVVRYLARDPSARRRA